MQREPCSPEGVRPWPVAPRPFDDEAFGGWLGRLAARYQISVDQLWQIGDLGAFPALTNSGWLLFPPMDEQALCRLAMLTHIGMPRLEALQTPMAWVSDRDQLPYCFDCLVLNPVDAAVAASTQTNWPPRKPGRFRPTRAVEPACPHALHVACLEAQSVSAAGRTLSETLRSL